MDEVIFTGRMSVDELREERPREYRDLIDSGKLQERLVEPMPAPIRKGLKAFGSIALIIYAEIVG